MKWALNLSSSRDNYKGVWINESIRLLGRGGIMNVTLVADTDLYADATRDADAMLTGHFNYVSGHRYAEWRSGDKIAAYGLSALVLGGGAAVAAKLGLFSQLGVFLAKMWKFVVVAVAAIGSFLVRLFRRITGSRPVDQE